MDMHPGALFNVEGLSVVVTGGATGIGFGYAQALADNGAQVTLLDMDSQALAAAANALGARGATVRCALVDVTDASALNDAMVRTASECGRLDVVFANAGITAGPGFVDGNGERDHAGAIENVPAELWDRVMATNLTGVFATMRAAIPQMKSQRSGRIIVTTSIAGLRPSAVVGIPYMIAKAAATHLVRQAALELAAYGVLVNAIAPGPFLTRITTPALRAVWEKALPVRRVATTDEMQGLALFLASPASSYVTGAVFVIDGGSLLGRTDP